MRFWLPAATLWAKLVPVFLLLLFCCGSAAVTASECVQNPVDFEIGKEPAPLPLSADEGEWLLLEERGHDLLLEGGAGEPVSIQIPPRFGSWLVSAERATDLRLKRLRPNNHAALLRVTRLCNLGDEAVRWWTSLATLARSGRMPTSISLKSDLAELAAMEEYAPDAKGRARAVHVGAQLLLMKGESSAAGAAFARAEEAWLSVGELGQAAAARVGRVEDLIRAGGYRKAIALAKSFRAAPKSSSYFATRLAGTICLAEDYLGELTPARACYSTLATEMTTLDEKLDAGSARIDLASIDFRQGRLESAERIYRATGAIAIGPQSELVRGRAELGLLDVALQRGQFSHALGHADAALHAFGEAKLTRWQANTLMKIGRVYVDLGASADARQTVEAALLLLNETDAPARVAAAKLSLAQVDRLDGDFIAALTGVESALVIYSRLEMQAEARGAQLDRIDLLLDLSNLESARKALDDLAQSADRQAASEKVRILLAEVRLAIRMNNGMSGTKFLDDLQNQSLSVVESIQKQRLRAELMALRGEFSEALTSLHIQSLSVRKLASQAGNPLLSELVLSQQQHLRHAAIDLIAAMPEPAPGERDSRLGLAWQWVITEQPLAAYSASQSSISPGASSVSRALAREFLAGSTNLPDPQAHRALLAVLEGNRSKPQQPDGTLIAASLEEFRRQLGTSEHVLVYLGGEQAGLRLAIARESATLALIAPPKHIRNEIGEARSVLQTPQGSLEELERHGNALSEALLQGMAASPMPKHLIIAVFGYNGDVPWLTLRWPGQSEVLGITTALSLAEPIGTHTADNNAAASFHLSVLNAPQGGLDELPLLEAASREADLIRVSVDQGITISSDTARRQTVLNALRRSGDWVHIASHGRGRDGRLGGSGLWLEPTAPGSSPEYFSGIDLYGQRNRSRLVVLNACDVGGAARMVRASPTQLPPALIRSGVDQVVAPQWPVSDSATWLWVPEFYRGVGTASNLEVARALQSARQRLQSSRMFRHPFYWASLNHYVGMLL